MPLLACPHIFTLQNWEEQIKLTRSLTIYLSLPILRIIAWFLAPWGSVRATAGSLHCPLHTSLLPAPVGIQPSSRGEENLYTHGVASVPLFNATEATEQITAPRISAFREDPFLARSCSPREEPAPYRHLWRTRLPKRASKHEAFQKLPKQPNADGSLPPPQCSKMLHPWHWQNCYVLHYCFKRHDRNASGRYFFYAYVCPRQHIPLKCNFSCK